MNNKVKIKYRKPLLELCNPNKQVETVLTDRTQMSAYEITLIEKVNETSELTFKMPFNNTKITSNDCEKLVKMDGQYYVIKSVSVSDYDSRVIEVSCIHESVELKGILCGTIDVIGVTVTDMYNAIMESVTSMQVGYVFKGTDIPDTTKRALQNDSEVSIYENLVAMAEVFQACLEFGVDVNGNKTIYLRKNPLNRGKYVKKKNGLKQLDITYDSNELFTKVIAFGETDSDGIELNIMEVNPTGKSYVENYDYFLAKGMTMEQIKANPRCNQEMIYRNSDIVDANDLYRLAVEELEKCSVPVLSGSIDMVDFSVFEGSALLAPVINEEITVIDKDINFSITAIITGIERNYDNPLQTKVTISNVIEYKSVFKDLVTAGEKIDKITSTDSNGNIVVGGSFVQGKIDAHKTQIVGMLGAIEKPEDKYAILFECREIGNPLYGAVAIGSRGILIGNEMDNMEQWIWKTAINANGISATEINTGILNADLIKVGVLKSFNEKSWINMEDGSFSFAGGSITYNATDGFKIHLRSDTTAPDLATELDNYKAEIDKEVKDINDKLTNIGDNLGQAFGDGIISQVEASMIKRNLEELNKEKKDIDTRYNSIYNNANLTNPEKLDLYNAYTLFVEKHNTIVSTVQDIILDDKATAEEITAFNLAFQEYAKTTPMLVKAFDSALTKISQNEITTQISDLSRVLGQDIANVADSVTSLETTMNESFRDGVIDEAEYIAIVESLNRLECEKLDIDKNYTNLYSNINLLDPVKTKFKTAYDEYIVAHKDLMDYVNITIGNRVASAEERLQIKTKLNNYNVKLSNYGVEQNNAINNIADNSANSMLENYKSLVDTDIKDLYAKIDKINGDIGGAIADGIIEKAEIIIIQNSINEISKEKADIHARYTEMSNSTLLSAETKKSLTDTYNAFSIAHDNLIAHINAMIADNIATPSEKDEYNRYLQEYTAKFALLSKLFDIALNEMSINNTNTVADALRTELQGNINDVSAIATKLQTQLGDYTADGILTEAEKKSIKAYLKTLITEKSDITNEYETIYANVDLTGNAKVNLGDAYNSYNNAYTSLVAIINALLEKAEITVTDQNLLDAKFTAHNEALATYSTKVNEAIDAISNKKKGDAVDEANSYFDAQILVHKTGILSTVSETYVSKETYNAQNMGGKNYALKSKINTATDFTNKTNECKPDIKINVPKRAKIGDTVTVSYIFEYAGLVKGNASASNIWFQGNGNVTGWNSGSWYGGDKLGDKITWGEAETGVFEITYSFKLSANHLLNDYWTASFRNEYISAGIYHIKELMVEVSDKKTEWVPAVEDSESYVDDVILGLEESLQNQIDSKIETFYQTERPHVKLTSVGTTHIEGERWLGDMWYNTSPSVKKTYIYTKTTTGSGSNINYIYDWSEQEIPTEIFNTLNGKGKIFTATPTAPYNVGDLWITALDGNGEIKTCINARTSSGFNTNDWVVGVKYTDDTSLNSFIVNYKLGTRNYLRMSNINHNSLVAPEGLSKYWTAYQGVVKRYNGYAGLSSPYNFYLTMPASTSYEYSSVSLTSDYRVINIPKGSKATLSMELFVDTNCKGYKLALFELDDNNNATSGKNTIIKTDTVSPNNNKLEITFTMPYDKCGLWIYNNGIKDKVVSTDSNLIFNKIKIEKGEIATDYSEAPEDTESKFDDALYVIENDLQTQIDNKIETWNQSNDPSTAWGTTALKEKHRGDLWYNSSEKKTYRWSGTAWVEQAEAEELAKTKKRVFTAKPTVPYDKGDLWILESDSAHTKGNKGHMLTCITTRTSGSYTASDWSNSISYTDDTLANKVQESFNKIQAGMKNELRNGNFEYKLKNWSVQDINSGGTNKSVTTTIDSTSTDINIPDKKSALIIRGSNTTERYGVISDVMTLQPNSKYIISGYCAGKNVSNIQLNVRDKDNQDVNIFTQNLEVVSGGNNLSDWYRFEVIFETKTNSRYTLNLYSVNFLADGYVWFMDVMLQQGEKASASFINSPLDTESYVDDLMYDLQEQIDNKIETWNQSNDPSTAWTTTDLKNAHKGDLWYNPNTYMTKRWGGTAWVKLENDEAKDASILAQSKKRVFYGSAIPTVPYDKGDLWITATDGTGDLKMCTTAKPTGGTYHVNDWVKATKYTDNSELTNFINNTYTSDVTDLQNTLDKKVQSYYQTTQPHSEYTNISTTDSNYKTYCSYVGDLWYNSSSSVKKTYIYVQSANGNNYNFTWVQQEIPKDIFDTIASKKSIYTSKPSSYNTNDLWILESDTVHTAGIKGEILTSTAGSSTYNASHWVKKISYTNDDKLEDFIKNYKVGMRNYMRLSNANCSLIIKKGIDACWVTQQGTLKRYDGYTGFNEVYNYCLSMPSSSVQSYALTKLHNDYKMIKIPKGTDVTLSMDLFVNENCKGFAITMTEMDISTGNTMGNTTTLITGTSNPVNNKIEVTFKMPYNAGEIHFCNNGVKSSSVSTDSNLVFNNIKLEIGTTASSWSLAPEDTETYFDNLVEDLQTQVDGKIETWNQTVDPSTVWNTTDLKIKHTGDIWYNPTTYITRRWSGTAWVKLENDEAKQAQELAEVKRRVFYTTPTPPYDKGDLWITALDGTGDLKIAKTTRVSGSYVGAEWVQATKYTDNTLALAVQEDLNNLTIGSRNYYSQANFVANGGTTVKYDSATNVYTVTVPASTSSWKGLRYNLKNAIVPAKTWCTISYEVYADEVFAMDADINNYNSTLGSGNDNDDSASRKLQVDFPNGANTVKGSWVKQAISYYNKNAVELYDQTVICVNNSIQTAKTFKVRNIQFELGRNITDFKPSPEDTESYVDDLVYDLQTQIDGKIETWSQVADPSTAWTTTDLKNKHKGDIWYSPSTYITKRWGGTAWVKLENDEAKNAQELAQSKAQIFTGTPTIPYYVGDLWILPSDTSHSSGKKGNVLICTTQRTSGSYTAGDWSNSISYTTIDQVASQIQSDIQSIKIGGRNLVKNSAFTNNKKATEGWSLATNVTLDTATTLNGHSSVKSAQSGLTADSWRGASSYQLTEPSLVEGEKYIASVWYYTTNTSAVDKGIALEVKGKVGSTTATETAVLSKVIGTSNLIANKWTKIEVSVSGLSSNVYSPCIRAHVVKNGTVWFTDFKLEKGTTISSNWTPAPEDTDVYTDNLISDLQEQVDSKIETWSQSTDPSTSWTTTDLKTKHKGDIWYNTGNYMTKRWSGTTWIKLENDEAKQAQELAQTKAQVFTGTPTIPYYVGDLWITATDKTGIVKTCTVTRTSGSYISSDWKEGLKYTDDTTANAVKSNVEQLSKTWTATFSEGNSNNLVRNSCFRNGLTNWTKSGSPTTFSAVSSTLGFGNALQIVTTSTNQYAYQSVTGLEVGTEYTLSAYVNSTVSCGIMVYNSGTITSSTLNVSNGTKQWLSVTFTAKATSATIRLGRGSFGANGTHYFTAIKVERGAQRTGWSQNDNEVIEGVTVIDKDGLSVNHSNINTSTRMSADGFTILDSNGDVIAWLSNKKQWTELNVDKVFAGNIENVYEGSETLYVDHSHIGESDGSVDKPFNSFASLQGYLELTPVINKNLTINIKDPKMEINEQFYLHHLSGVGTMEINLLGTLVIRSGGSGQPAIRFDKIDKCIKLVSGREFGSSDTGAVICDNPDVGGGGHGIIAHDIKKLEVDAMTIACKNWGIACERTDLYTWHVDFGKCYTAVELRFMSMYYSSDDVGSNANFCIIKSGSKAFWGYDGGTPHRPQGNCTASNGIYYSHSNCTPTPSTRYPDSNPTPPSTSQDYTESFSWTGHQTYQYQWSNWGDSECKQGSWGYGLRGGHMFFDVGSIRNWMGSGIVQDGNKITLTRASNGGLSSQSKVYINGSTCGSASGTPSYGDNTYLGTLGWGETKIFDLPKAIVEGLKNGTYNSLAVYVNSSANDCYINIVNASITLKVKK